MKTPFLHFSPNSGPTSQVNASVLNSVFTISLLVLPFGYMTVKGLFGVLSAICLFLAILILITDPKSIGTFLQEKYSLPIIFTMLSITISIFISQAIRQQFILNAYDGSSRLILALPILIAIYRLKIDFGKILGLSLPLALLAILIYAKSGSHNYGDRLTNHYLDPIFWGNFSIIMGTFCLASIRMSDSITMNIYKLLGLGLGVTMSILSQSRAGWVAALAMIAILLFVNRKQLTPNQLILYCVLTTMILAVLYLTVNSFQSRIDTAISEIINWINKTETESSTGHRLTMWKMTAHLFSLSPWIGYGDYSALPIMGNAYIQSFADAESLKTIQCCGPHNEIAAQILRSGIFGFIALLATYFLPAYIFSKLKDQQIKSMGMMLCVGFFVCGFGTEMLSLKISYTFYAIQLAGLLATSLWKNNAQK